MNGLTPTITVPEPGLTDIVGWMQKFAVKGKKDLVIRQLAEDICKDLVQGDYSSEALAVYYWCCQNIRYMRDINGIEFLKEPRQLLETKSGDCDDISTLLASLLESMGNRCAFTLVSFGRPPVPTHVYCSIQTPSGLVPLDPVANRAVPEMLKKVTSLQNISVDTNSPAKGTLAQPISGPGDPPPGSTQDYSVYNYATRLYTYYRGPAVTLPPSGWFRRPRAATSAEVLAVQVPAGAKPVGTGTRPRGVIGTLDSTVGSVGISTLGEAPPQPEPLVDVKWFVAGGIAGLVMAMIQGDGK